MMNFNTGLVKLVSHSVDQSHVGTVVNYDTNKRVKSVRLFIHYNYILKFNIKVLPITSNGVQVHE